MNTEITIQVPAGIASQLGQSGELSRKALEGLAIEGYREGRISIGLVAEMLNLSVLETEEFLHSKGVTLNYSMTDFEDDIKTAKTLAETAAPLHEAFRNSGMTQEELDDFTDELIREVRAEKRLRNR